MTSGGFQIDGRQVLFDWLAQEPNEDVRQAMLDWLWEFSREPLDRAMRVPGIRAPVYEVRVPVRRLVLRFLFAEQFRTVKLIKFDTLP